MAWLKANEWAASWLEVLAIVVGLGSAGAQLGQVADQAEAEANAAATEIVYTRQHEINEVFLQNPELSPYFYENAQLPDTGDADSANITRQAQAVASDILDFFEVVRFTIDSGDFNADVDSWSAYLSESFSLSPVLCVTLLENREYYGGTNEWALWPRFAQPVCAS